MSWRRSLTSRWPGCARSATVESSADRRPWKLLLPLFFPGHLFSHFLRQSGFLLWCTSGSQLMAAVRHWVRTALTQGMMGTTRTITIAEMKASGSCRPCPWPSHWRNGMGWGGGAIPCYGTNMSLFFVWMSGDLLSLFIVSHFIWNGVYTV